MPENDKPRFTPYEQDYAVYKYFRQYNSFLEENGYLFKNNKYKQYLKDTNDNELATFLEKFNEIKTPINTITIFRALYFSYIRGIDEYKELNPEFYKDKDDEKGEGAHKEMSKNLIECHLDNNFSKKEKDIEYIYNSNSFYKDNNNISLKSFIENFRNGYFNYYYYILNDIRLIRNSTSYDRFITLSGTSSRKNNIKIPTNVDLDTIENFDSILKDFNQCLFSIDGKYFDLYLEDYEKDEKAKKAKKDKYEEKYKPSEIFNNYYDNL